MTTVDAVLPAPATPARRRAGRRGASVLYDAPGPRARRRILLGTVLAAVVLAAFTGYVLVRLDHYGHLQQARWSYVLSPEILRYLGEGLLNNLKASVVAAAAALVIGLFLALGRLSRHRALHLPAVAWIEFFRGFPLVLLIIFPYLLFPVYLSAINPIWYLVIGLTLYNSAVMAEIYRAGIVSLDRGQREAALAVGLRAGQAMRLVILPQAIRRMVPLLLTQTIVLFKDSTLGVAVTFPDALRRGETMGSFEPRVVFQAIVITAVLFFLCSFTLSRLVALLSRDRTR